MAERRESVTLVLNDQMSAQLARASAVKKAFDRGMDGKAVSAFGRDMDSAGDNINQFSGRLRVILNAVTALGPAFVPIGGVAVPAIAGLATQLGFAAVAAGAVIGSFQGVGDALKAVDAAALEPTAENLAKAQKALEDLAPAGRELVSVVDGQLQPALRDLRDIGQENLFPGVIDGIESLLTRAPEFGRIMEELTRASGDIFADFGEGIASSGADEFFAYLEREARPTLVRLAETIGNVSVGLAEMAMAAQPLTNEFASDLVAITADFREWASNLSESSDFRGFMDYIIRTGPQVADTFGALVGALSAVVQAAAPLGGPVLRVLESLFNTIERLASSNAGVTLLALATGLAGIRTAMTLLGALRSPFVRIGDDMATVGARARSLRGDLTLATASVGQFGSGGMVAMTRAAGAADRLKGSLRGMAGTAGIVAGLGVAASGAADGIGLANTATLALMGSALGIPGAIGGAAVGAILDFAKANDDAAFSAEYFASTLDRTTGAMTEMSRTAVAQTLENRGLLDWAEQNGIALDELVDAAIRGGDAIEQLSQRTSTDLFPEETVQRATNLREALDQSAVSYTDFARSGTEMDPMISVLQEVSDTIAEGGEQAERLRESLGLPTSVFAPLQTGVGNMMEFASAAGEAAGSVDALAESMGLLNRTLSASQAMVDYERAVDDLAESWTGGAGVNRGMEQGRKNIELLNGVADRAAKGFATFTEQGKRAAAQKVATQAIADLREFAADNPGAQAHIRKLIRGLKDLGRTPAEIEARMELREFQRAERKVRDAVKGLSALLPTPRADLDDRQFRRVERGIKSSLDFLDRQVAKPLVDLIDRATGPINGVLQNLQDLDGDRATVTINTRFTSSGRRGATWVATGGHITGPGTSTSDSIPAWLSNGEFVVRTRAVEHYGADFFHRLNAMQFAGGGQVGRSPNVSVSTPGVDYERLAVALVRAGFGNITVVNPDPAGVLRQFDQRMQTAVTMLAAAG